MMNYHLTNISIKTTGAISWFFFNFFTKFSFNIELWNFYSERVYYISKNIYVILVKTNSQFFIEILILLLYLAEKYWLKENMYIIE
jgi:hypothetical protein